MIYFEHVRFWIGYEVLKCFHDMIVTPHLYARLDQSFQVKDSKHDLIQTLKLYRVSYLACIKKCTGT